jgi:hypothetical protein
VRSRCSISHLTFFRMAKFVWIFASHSKCIEVRHATLFTDSDFYIGCSSASIHIQIEGGSIDPYTPHTRLTVNYKDTETRSRNSEATLEPSVTVKSSGVEGNVTFGKRSLDAGSQSEFRRSYVGEERRLAPVCTGNGVTWRLDPATQTHAVRDFLFCNLHVFAECRFTGKWRSGSIKVHPSDVTFYDSSRRPWTPTKSLLKWFSLHRAKRKLFRPRGVTVKFSEGTQ